VNPKSIEIMKKLFLLGCAFLCTYFAATSQVMKDKDWCPLACDAAGDEKANTSMVHDIMNDEDVMKEVLEVRSKKRIPLRFGIVQSSTSEMMIEDATILTAIEHLNHSFAETGFEFYHEVKDVIASDLKLEDLSANFYAPYTEFSDKHDKEDVLTVYVFDHGKEFCDISETSVSCGRTGGFSYILSERTNNIVMSRFDLTDIKVLAHEMGHFWGLYHTFEEAQFGKDNFDQSKCAEVGDRICDTPPDPGPIFEVHINYTTCEFMNFTNDEGKEYKPMIENFMSYYKPCYLKEYAFTHDQVMVMKTAGMQEMRQKFFR